MTSHIHQVFNLLALNKKKALIPFLTANFPTRSIFNDMLHALPLYGASLIEIGIPFSDPYADGHIIQQTSAQAITHGFTMHDLFEDIREFKATHSNVPIVLMTYLNPIIQCDNFIQTAQKSGIDGLLVVDLPPNHTHTVFASNHLIDMIRLVTPTTALDRIPLIASHASGFLYYVSVKGVTGTKEPDLANIQSHISLIQASVALPTVIGFGIRSRKKAKEMANISDGIVIGSALLEPFLTASDTTYASIKQDQLAFIQSIYQEINK